MSNLPESRDDALLGQVDRVLLDGARSGSPTLDDLSGLKPQARPAFQQQLEEKLVAQLDKSASGRNFMPVYSQKRKRQPFRLPFSTIAAAMVGLFFGAAVMFALAVHQDVGEDPVASSLGCVTPTWTGYHRVETNDTISSIAAQYNVTGSELIQQNCLRPAIIRSGMRLRVPEIPAGTIAELTAVAVATPVFPELPTVPAIPSADLAPVAAVVPPVPAGVVMTIQQEGYIPLVIAADDIPAGTVINMDMVTRIYVTRETLATVAISDDPLFNADLMANDTPPGYYGSVADVAGQTTLIKIPRWQPITGMALQGKQTGAGKTVGILLSMDEPGHCGSSPQPVEVSNAVGHGLADILRAHGYNVTILYPVSTLLDSFDGDALIALYTDGCQVDKKQDVSGFLPVRVEIPNPVAGETEEPAFNKKDALMQCVIDSYAAGTGLERRMFRTVDSSYTYDFFQQIDPNTPALALRLGSLAKNHDYLTEHQAEMALALAAGIDCYFNPVSSSLAANTDIAAILPQDTVAIAVPLNNLTTVAYSVKEGDKVRILAALMFVESASDGVELPAVPPVPEGETRTEIRTVVREALVVKVGSIPEVVPAGVAATEQVVTLAVAPQDAVTIQWLMEAKVPLTLESAD